MRRFIIAALLLGLVAIPASAAPSRLRCGIRGTPKSDIMSGTQGPNVMCARGAPDYAAGQDGRDSVRGGSQGDTLVGGSGADHVIGRAGDDKLFAVDGHGNDVVRGGRGFDRCYGEKGDKFRGCEVKVTNHSPEYPRAMVLALSNALEGTMRKANNMLCQEDVVFCFIIIGGIRG